MLLVTDQLTELLGAIYDAAGDAALWGEFLRKLARTTRADSAALVMHQPGRDEHAVVAGWNMDPQGTRLYNEYYGLHDIWAKRVRPDLRGYVCTSESLCPQPELTSTEFYNDFLTRHHITHGLFGIIENDVTRLSSVSLYRDTRSGGFETSEMKVVSLVLPHVQQALRLHFQFAELQARTQNTESALNMLTVGVVFVGSDGKIVQMNSKAEDLLRKKDGMMLVHERLSAAAHEEATRLRATIRDAVRTSNGKGTRSGGIVPVSRKKGRPLSVRVAPVRNSGLSLVHEPSAVIFISDPDQKVELPADLLHRYYGLTMAEARLTMVLVEGRSLKEAADICDVTHNTAKSQLKSIFVKTNVQRQSELVKVLLVCSSGAIAAS
jgi:DNA-binding CsgD family transcriptional regulator/PAS domain-containing protein